MDIIEWENQLQMLINNENCTLNDFKFSIEELGNVDSIPNIIKASYQIFEESLDRPSSRNIIVLPERKYSAFIFTMCKIIDDFKKNRISKNYDLSHFSTGEKIKVGNCIAKYMGIENEETSKKIKLEFADWSYKCPINIAPILKKTSTKTKLSKLAKFMEEKSCVSRVVNDMESFESINDIFRYFSTHTDGTVLYLTQIGIVKDLINRTKINNERILDLMLIGHFTVNEDLIILSPNQIDGNPILTVMSDLESVLEYLDQARNIRALCIDFSNPKLIHSQLFIFDEILKKNIPTILISDTENSLDMDFLFNRDFKIWRWNSENIVESLRVGCGDLIGSKINNILKFKKTNRVFDDKRLDRIFSIINKYRQQEDDLNQNVLKILQTSYSYLFTISRQICPFSQETENRILKELDKCKEIILGEKRFISSEQYSDFQDLLEFFFEIMNDEFVMPKIEHLGTILSQAIHKSICLIVDPNSNKDDIKNYWDFFCQKLEYKTKIEVYYPIEFNRLRERDFRTIFVCAWLNQSNMKSIIFSNSSSYIEILLYRFETVWSSNQEQVWNRRLKFNENMFKDLNFLPPLEILEVKPLSKMNLVSSLQNSVDDLEKKIKEYKYNEYSKVLNLSDGSNKVDVVSAIPFELCGNSIVFYKPSSEVVTVTGLLLGETDVIEIMSSDKLRVGDFIVVRDSQKDIIRDLADSILIKNGLIHLRKISKKWKETLLMMSISDSPEEISLKLSNFGCNKTVFTIREWLNNEQRIMPRSRNDIIAIANAADDEVLSSMIDSVFSAGKTVRNAHLTAGMELSNLLKTGISNELGDRYDIDPYSFENPYSINVSNIGQVKIFKIVDIGPMVSIDLTHTHKVIERKG